MRAFFLSIVLFIVGAVCLGNADALNLKTKQGLALFGGGYPQALVLNGGIIAPNTINFTQNIGKLQNTGIVPATSIITVTRASPHTCSDTSGNWYSVGNNVLCQTNRGALIEEARINVTRNNSITGAAAGSPGTLPTNWVQNIAPTGLTRTISLTTTNGIPTISINYAGTTTSTAIIQLLLDAANVAAASSGQTWTTSGFIQIGSDPSVTSVFLEGQGTNGTSQTETFASSNLENQSSFARVSGTGTLAQGTTTDIRQQIITNSISSGTTINWTLTLGWPQLELNPGSVGYASSPIVTSGSAVTRAADGPPVFVNVPVIGSKFFEYVSIIPLAPTNYTAAQELLEISDSSTTNRGNLTRTSANGYGQQNGAGNVTAVSAGYNGGTSATTTLATGAISKTAGTFTTTGAMNKISIGGEENGAAYCNCYVQKLAIDPQNNGYSPTGVTSGPGSFLFERDIPANDNFPRWFADKAA